MWPVFSLAVFKIVFHQFYYNVFCCGSLFDVSFGVGRASWIVRVMDLCPYWCLGRFYPLFFQILFLYVFSFWDPYRSLKLFSVFKIHFPFYSSDSIILIILSSSSLILLHAWICSSVPLVKFLFQLLHLSAPKFLGFCFHFLSFYWYFHFFSQVFFLIFFSSLSMFSLNSYSIFKTVVLKCLASNSDAWTSFKMIYINLFCSFEWDLLPCFFVYIAIFGWKLYIYM